jgi:dipeptidyl aminopeptidase/acylaminoacyl peptidase
MRRVFGLAAPLVVVIVAAGPDVLGQAGVIAPAANLVAENIPPIPASIAQELRRYTEFRSATFADWHPARREMLIATRFGNTPQIHAVGAPGGARRQLTFSDEPITVARYQPNDAWYLVFLRDTGGNEFRQIYRLDLRTGVETLITDGGRSQHGWPLFNHRGNRIAYVSTRRNGADRDVYVMDPADPSTDRLLLQVSGGGWNVVDWSPDDSRLLVQEYHSISRSTLWLVDASSGAKEALTPPGAGDVANPYGLFAADGRGAFIVTDRDSEFLRLAYVTLAGKTVEPLTRDIPWDVAGFDLSADGRTLAFVANEAGVSRLYFLDTATRAYRAVSAVPPGVIGMVKWHPRLNELAFVLNSARSASDVYSIAPESATVTRWTDSELGGLVPAELSEPALISWTSFDGLKITGFYYRPHARFTGPRPVIVNIHGGPEGQSLPVFTGRNNYYLNELGVAMIFPNVRGSTGYGKTFVNLDNGMKREDSVRDIGALLDWIRGRPELDAGRVMVTGGSYGGFMTLAVATTYNDRIACAVDVVGISNFNTFLKNTESYRRDLRRAEYGDERLPEMVAFFERTAPLNRAERITKPLMVVQGGNDPRVPRTESEQMVARVRRNGTPVWYLMANDEGHGFQKKSNVDFQFYATVTFVRNYLLSER